jgi:hypothetical protein
MIKHRKSCSRPGGQRGQPRGLKPGKVNARAEMGNRELDTASLHEVGKAKPSESAKPAGGRSGDERVRAFPGVKGVSACGKRRKTNDRELGRPLWRAVHRHGTRRDESISRGVAAGESERPVVATKRVTTVERRGLGWEHAESEATNADWRKPKTEEAATAVESIGSRDRSWAVRPSPAEQAGCMSDGKVVLDESRMREIRTSGSTRGRATLVRVLPHRCPLPTLLPKNPSD